MHKVLIFTKLKPKIKMKKQTTKHKQMKKKKVL